MFDIKENLKELPDKPGVYMHKDKLGQIIYVGKASSLKNRVRQYFQSTKGKDSKVKAMVSHIEEFEYITTATEMEALILECTLIKKYMPKYNVLLRDDKTYPYIKITMQEDYPRLLKTRKIEKDGAKYFGPYTDVNSVNMIVDLLNSTLMIKRCTAKTFPSTFRPCLNYHINHCKGVCGGFITVEEYNKNIENAIGFLNGKTKPLTDFLKERMEEESEKLNFERAAEYRDYMNSVESIKQKQNVVILGARDMDIVTILKGIENNYAVIFYVRDGNLSGRETHTLQTTEDATHGEMTRAFIEQYYSETLQIPGEILIQYDFDEKELMEEFLATLCGKKVKIAIPVRGEKKSMVELVKRDLIEMAKDIDAKALNAKEREENLKKEIEVILGDYYDNNFFGSGFGDWDSACPNIKVNGMYRIEAYDISNINGIDSVGAMVVFQGIKPVKKDYRRFKIKTIKGANDYGSIQEVVYRRFKRLNEDDSGFSKLPNILFVDGGFGQVSVTLKILRAMNITIPVFGMMKDEKHRTRSLVFMRKTKDGFVNREITLKDKPMLYKYVGTIQEEVHRFAIEYHRGIRNKSVQVSVLDEIKGIGKVKRNILLSAFGAIEPIKNAEISEIEKIEGISRGDAERIYKFFH